MKKIKDKKAKSVVEELREIRDKIGIEIQDMTFEQLKKYFQNKSSLHPSSVWK